MKHVNIILAMACVILLASCDFTVERNADDPRSSSFSQSEIDVSFSGTGVLSGSTADIGSSVVSVAKDVTFRIDNTGNSALVLDGAPKVALTGSDAFEVLSYPSDTVPAGEYTEFIVRFTPDSTGTVTSSVTISNNDLDEAPFVFTIEGEGTAVPEPDMNLKEGGTTIADGGSHYIGATGTGIALDAEFTIENLGGADLVLDGTPAVLVGGTHSTMFTVITQPGTPVDADDTTSFTLRFLPTSSGTKTATLTILNNDPDEGMYSITVTAGASEPEIHLKQGTTDISSGGAYGFGNVDTGSNKDVVFTIENNGSYELVLDGSPLVDISGTDATDFDVTVYPSSTIESSSSDTFTIRFTPSDMGSKTATVSISNNDPDEDPYTFTITGNGMEPDIHLKQGTTSIADGGSFTISGSRELGEEVDLVFTIENNGTKILTLDGSPLVAVSGTDADMFTVTAQPDSTVPASGSKEFTLRFIPADTGTCSATISIASTDPDEDPYNFNISGTGIDFDGIRTLDSTGDVGMHASIAASGDDVYIAYFDNTNNKLIVGASHNGGGTWDLTELHNMADGDGVDIDIALVGSYVYVAFVDQASYYGDLYCATSSNGGSSWNVVEVGTSYWNPCIAVAGSGANVYLIRYGHSGEGVGGVYLYKSTNYGASWGGSWVYNFFNSGTYNDLAVSGSSLYAIYYMYNSDPFYGMKMHRSTNSGASWSQLTVEGYTQSGDLYPGEYSSIAVSGDDLYVSSQERVNYDLRFLKSTDGGSSWTALNIDTANNVGQYTSIALSGSYVYISYYDATADDLKLARSANSGSSWTYDTVDTSGDVGQYSSIAVSGDVVYILYYDNTNGDLKFAKSLLRGNEWLN